MTTVVDRDMYILGDDGEWMLAREHRAPSDFLAWCQADYPEQFEDFGPGETVDVSADDVTHAYGIETPPGADPERPDGYWQWMDSARQPYTKATPGAEPVTILRMPWA